MATLKMSSADRGWAWTLVAAGLLLVGAMFTVPARATDRLRVCADPYNLPFSNQKGRGFENMLAQMLTEDQGVPLDYEWTSQARGSLRAALAAQLCDVILGVAGRPGTPGLSQPYYRSRWYFVTRADRHLDLSTLSDLRLAKLRVGMRQDPSSSASPLMASLGAAHNVRAFEMHTARPAPNAIKTLIDAVTFGDVDVAVAWGPAASYFAERSVAPLELQPIEPDGGTTQDLVRDVSMAVRPEDTELLARLNDFLTRRAADIRQLLADYHVPLTDDEPRRPPSIGGST